MTKAQRELLRYLAEEKIAELQIETLIIKNKTLTEFKTKTDTIRRITALLDKFENELKNNIKPIK